MHYFKTLIWSFLLLLSTTIGAQQPDSVKQVVAHTSLNLFVDNTEFSGSAYTTDQTMAGVALAQTVGWQFNTHHSIHGGLDALKQFGTRVGIDKVDFLAFYQFENSNTLFRAGSFLWNELLNDYNSFFFQDSIRYYKHTLDGLFLKKTITSGYIKLWLDWSGLQTATDRERFLMGISGFRSFKNSFHVDFQTYMVHLAGTRPYNPAFYVNDYLLAQATAGYQYHTQAFQMLVAAGLLVGYERNRKNVDKFYTPIGFVGKADMRYRQFGTKNLIYAGQPRMKLYSIGGNQLYYGNPFLKGKFYWQNKLYWIPFDTEHVKSELALRMHFSQKKLYFEQLFTLSVNL